MSSHIHCLEDVACPACDEHAGLNSCDDLHRPADAPRGGRDRFHCLAEAELVTVQEASRRQDEVRAHLHRVECGNCGASFELHEVVVRFWTVGKVLKLEGEA